MEISLAFYKAVLDTLSEGVYCVDTDKKIVYWSKAAEKISGYSAREMEGKYSQDTFLKHIDEGGVGLCPLSQSLLDGAICEQDISLRHKEGHRLSVDYRIAPVMNGEGKVIGAVETFSENSTKIAAMQRIERLERESLIDHLTGLPNRRYMESLQAARYYEMLRYGRLYGIIFIDIDDFKQVNDSYGHETGDSVLRMVAKTLSGVTRSFEVVGRWGGEEFLAVLWNLTPSELTVVANRYRTMVEHSMLPMNLDSVQVTISLGATLAAPGESMESVVERADKLMYRSKTRGKNRVSV